MRNVLGSRFFGHRRRSALLATSLAVVVLLTGCTDNSPSPRARVLTTTATPAMVPDDPAYPCWGLPDSVISAAGLDPRSVETNGLDNQKRCRYSGSDGLETTLRSASGTFIDLADLPKDPGVVYTSLEFNGRTAVMSDMSGNCDIELKTASRPFVVMVFHEPGGPDNQPEQQTKTACQQAELAARLFEPYIRG